MKDLNILYSDAYWKVPLPGGPDGPLAAGPEARPAGTERAPLERAESFEGLFEGPRRAAFGGPATTVRNVVRGFRSLGVDFDLNDPDFEAYRTNLALFLPGSRWRGEWLRRFLFDESVDTSRFFLHTLVEVRQMFDQLHSAEVGPETRAALVRQSRRATHLAESPKQYFRLRNNVRPLFDRLHLSPVGFADDLRAPRPYWERDEVVLLVKDHHLDYDVAERAQHLRDLLEAFGIPYHLFECHSGRSFVQSEYLGHLERARFMVAWDVEETHGHCMHEAKALDVPIFTTTPNGMNYFSDQCGVIALENELYEAFERFLGQVEQRLFRPRAFVDAIGLDNRSTCENLLRLFAGEESRYRPSGSSMAPGG